MSGRFAITVLGLVAALLAGCGVGRSQAEAWQPCGSGGDAVFVRLSRTGGIAGVNETLAVHCDGAVELDGGVITRDKAMVSTLITQLRDSGVLELRDGEHIPDGVCNDCFEYALELNDGTTARQWNTIELDMPVQISKAIDALYSIQGVR